MELREHADVTAFLAVAEPLLSSDEPRHNLIYGICSTLTDVPDTYPDALFWSVEDGGETMAALLRTPPFNVAVARPLREGALAFAAESLRAGGLEAPGVTGAVPEGEEFARAWTDSPRLRMAQGVYAARGVRLPEGVGGEAREATEDDLPLLVDWLRAFEAEALPDEAPHLDLEEMVGRRLKREGAGFVLWEDESRRVSVCGYGGRTPHGTRIGPVYTPPERRGRGYGSAVTAHATRQQLDRGLDYCFLYTDLSNPTSNKIYMNIGYEFVCDSADYAFD
jgi:predicted GNAT family acetyltransferase